MDQQTITAYDQQAENIAQLHAHLKPLRLYKLIEEFFIPQGLTADIGCGIGRDSFYLQQQNFKVLGVDASKGMLQQAKCLYPEVEFIHDALPKLKTFKTAQFQNILCSAVLMHLPQQFLEAACQRLVQLLSPQGCLIISIRNTLEPDNREQGKLYEPIDNIAFKNLFKALDCKVVFSKVEIEQSRHLYWQNSVIKRNSSPHIL